LILSIFSDHQTTQDCSSRKIAATNGMRST